MSSVNYQCARGTTKDHNLKSFEGLNLKCTVDRTIVPVSTKCNVKCETGEPNYSEVFCKNAGWRPTNELACEGVNAGVVVGALIGGLVAVIILAILYAKYKQHKKRKNKAKTSQETGKINLNQKTNRRPGRIVGIPNDDAPHSAASSGYVGSEADPSVSRENRASWKNNGNRSKPSSYGGDDVGELPSSSNTGSRIPPDMPQHGRRGRSHHSKKNRSAAHPEGYQHVYPARYQYEEGHSIPQVGYNNGAYYQAQNPDYRYTGNEPAIGYGATFAHPQSYPTSRDYNRPYHVPT